MNEPTSGRPTILCLGSFNRDPKAPFLRASKDAGSRVLLLTTEETRPLWPEDIVDHLVALPQPALAADRESMFRAVDVLARDHRIDLVVPLDEFDVELAASVREHLRLPGMGESAVRYFRDKLAMRMRAQERGLRIPAFVHALNRDAVRAFLAEVPGPWMLKPRNEAASHGVRRVDTADEVFRLLEEFGDKLSNYLIEQRIPGESYHVDAFTSGAASCSPRPTNAPARSSASSTTT